MIVSIIRNRILLTIVLSLIVISILLLCSPVLHVLNKNIQNTYYSFKNSIFQPQVSSNIVIATIDKETLESLGRFPFKRSVYATFIENVETAGAATIGFDIIFADESIPEEDSIFAAALSNANIPIVFGSAITSQGEIETPIDMFQNHIYSTGFLPLNINISNGRTYSFSPTIAFNGVYFEHFALSVLRAFYSYMHDTDMRKSYYDSASLHTYSFIDNLRLPISSASQNDILISFVPSIAFTQIPFSDLYDAKKIRQYDLKDSIILVGPTADGIKDEFFTPFGLEYGVFAHGNIINTVLSRNFLTYFDKESEWILLFLLIITSVYFNLGYSRKTLFISNILLILLFMIVIPVGIFLFTNLLMNYPIEILVALILSQTLSNAAKYFIEDKNKQRLKKSLSEYVGSDIAQEVLEEEGKINFDGEEKQSVLFFSDIEGFTTMSEKLPPRKLVGFLREYLSKMSDVILDEKGYINKYEGDAIMALWGVFNKLEKQDYMSVCRASLQQMELLHTLNKDWLSHYGQEVHIRIGIHAGDVIVGNIGSVGRKMEFTALGDTVNIASRLEGVNKFYGTHICASEAIYTATKNKFEYRFLDSITVKGKRTPLKIYELLSRVGQLTPRQQEIRSKFQVALDAYLNKDFQKAKLLFNELVGKGDKPSLTFKSRCSMYLLNPPEANWDGVWKMEAK